MSHPILSPKKLIEVALPLDAINVEAAREKSIRHGHPSTLHLWWARRPLAAARAVIFAQLVNDPASLWEAQNPGKEPSQQQRGGFTQRRDYLFRLISELVKWENTTNEEILGKAREEIRKSWREVCELNKDHPEAQALFNPDEMPGLHDPFAGGGTIPLEAQRLGLKAYASDLNPVAVLINKAMIEIPPKFAGMPPVHPDAQATKHLRTWKGAEGLAEDVRLYGKWMRDEAFKRIGHLYPPVKVTKEMAAGRPDLEPYVGKELTVIAWLWARTVKSPNPAFSHVDVPLVSSFVLAQKPGKEAWVEPIVEGDSYRFEVKMGIPPAGSKNGTRTGVADEFFCLMSRTPLAREYARGEGTAGRMGARLMAVVLEGAGSRIYLSPPRDVGDTSLSSEFGPEIGEAAATFLSGSTPSRAMMTGGVCSAYGLHVFADLFTWRQTLALVTFSNLVETARGKIRSDMLNRHQKVQTDENELNNCSDLAMHRADAISVYLAMAVDRSADFWSCLCTWANQAKNELVAHVFTRQSLTMTWDYAEANPFSASGGNFLGNLEYIAKGLTNLPGVGAGNAWQRDAQSPGEERGLIVSTDPPYFDNIGYAELSDFFYVWLRRSLRNIYPSLFMSIVTPKDEELVANAFKQGGKAKAVEFFMKGMLRALARVTRASHDALPITIYYAFKQAETSSDGAHSSSGWVSFLSALNDAGLALTGTWPLRTERSARTISLGTNALASSIVLVCRKRPDDAQVIGRRELLRELNATLPAALDEMTRGIDGGASPVAPVDLSQAIIGPGMAIFSRYKAVLEADGTPMTVRTALQLINRFLAEDDFDGDTQFCLHWFEGHGWQEGLYGEADVLARAKATSVGGLDGAGVLISGGGKVRLRRWAEYPDDWDPQRDKRLPVWEALHQLIRVFRLKGETGAGKLLASGPVRSKGEAVRQLAYRLYTLCERRGWAEDARAYNELVTSWSPIEAVASAIPEVEPQLDLFGGGR